MEVRVYGNGRRCGEVVRKTHTDGYDGIFRSVSIRGGVQHQWQVLEVSLNTGELFWFDLPRKRTHLKEFLFEARQAAQITRGPCIVVVQ